MCGCLPLNARGAADTDAAAGAVADVEIGIGMGAEIGGGRGAVVSGGGSGAVVSGSGRCALVAVSGEGERGNGVLLYRAELSASSLKARLGGCMRVSIERTMV